MALSSKTQKKLIKVLGYVLLFVAGVVVALVVQNAMSSNDEVDEGELIEALDEAVEEEKESEATVTVEILEEELSSCSDLATAKLSYRGVVSFEEGSIPLINKKNFLMVYSAEIRAGVDLSEASIVIDGQNITVTLPEATIQVVDIDSDSIEFYDESFALFNGQDMEDVVEALTLAQEDAEEQIDMDALLEEATEQAQLLVETLLSPFELMDDGYEITVNVTESTETDDESEDEDAEEEEAEEEESEDEDAESEEEAA